MQKSFIFHSALNESTHLLKYSLEISPPVLEKTAFKQYINNNINLCSAPKNLESIWNMTNILHKMHIHIQHHKQPYTQD